MGEGRFEYRKGASSKFWSIRRDGKAVSVTFGRIGSAGKTVSKRFTDVERAAAFVDARTREKVSKGYRRAGDAGDLAWKAEAFDWRQAHKELWKAWVPASGQAKTVQGELTRRVGKLTDEAYRNGNCNWDGDCVTMWRWVGRVLDDETFTPKERARIRRTVGAIIRDQRSPDLSGSGSTYYYVCEMAARWCVAHPEPRPYKSDPKLKR